MSNDESGRDDKTRLRQRAEQKLGRTALESLEILSPEEMNRLVHELQVHQIELEMQNEELRLAQQELESLQAKYFDLYDLAPVGYLSMNEKSLIQEANLTATRLLGLTRDSLNGRPLTQFILPEDQDIYYRHRRKLFETGEPQACELRMLRKDGTRPWIRLEAVLVVDSHSDTSLCRTTLSDVSELRTLEASLAQADRLSHMGVLAASIAHELNNPLTYVHYNITSLAEDLSRLARDKGEGRRSIETVALDDLVQTAAAAVEGIRRVKEITSGLGFFSRVDDADQTAVDLNQAVRHAINMTSNETRFRAQVVKDFGKVPPILASEGKLAQVFLNLITNAAHAIEEGDIPNNRITVRTWAEGDRVLAEVTDTGKGIPIEDLGRIFDPFFTTKPMGHGTGLGLSITRRIVSELGGEIHGESRPGNGSRFVVRLPVTRVKTKTLRTPSTETGGVHGRILIVDDEEMLRTVLRRMLAAHDIVLAVSGEDGRAILETDQDFDLILCDLMMPGMTGMDLHTWLADQNPSLAERTVFITGGAFTPRASNYLALTGNPVVQKPFDTRTLQRFVSDLIAAHRASG